MSSLEVRDDAFLGLCEPAAAFLHTLISRRNRGRGPAASLLLKVFSSLVGVQDPPRVAPNFIGFHTSGSPPQ